MKVANPLTIFRTKSAKRYSQFTMPITTLLGQPGSNLKPAALSKCGKFIKQGYNEVQGGRRLAALRQALFEPVLSCPYCALSAPRELDHYLPKSDYEALAIYPLNLIPVCSDCNKAKGSFVPEPPLAPGFFHPYFQTLPDTTFMCAKVDFTDGALDVEFRIERTKINPELAVMLQFQLDRIKLNSRNLPPITHFLFAQRTSMLALYSGGGAYDQVSDFLRRSAKSMAKDYGANDWRPALLVALADNHNFCSNPKSYFSGFAGSVL